MERGRCLASHEIRQLIQTGRLVGTNIADAQIQPASFDATIGSECYILDTESEGVFRPQKNQSIYKTLLQMGERKRHKVDITNGFEIKKGFTYLFPLRERVIVKEGEYIKSSNKSSFGRLFLNARMLTDYNPSFNEVNSHYKENEELRLWLLVQPLAFNLIIYPGIAINQLRFFTGYDSQLHPSEIMQEFAKTPLLHHPGNNSSLSVADAIVTDGLQIHLDVSGRNEKGIVGLRARHNPNPIDLQKIGEHEVEHYFEPILKDDMPIRIIKGEHYLFASKEVLSIPPHLSCEVKAYSDVGLAGPLHFAGFIDNGFQGDLVFEVRSDEVSSMLLEDGMPISKLDFFWSQKPD
ncbi:TPA: 2'-deoxycytidine 5'-triphosphate deaminase, partial [Candidatus Woesearchaeota archaeon]|nr:2'-deoxycytidine 5'-triphosphate deaminase [Candidatus Woesearchaeota archaeon]